MEEPITNRDRVQLHISVRRLVEFIKRSGDIDETSEGSVSLKSLQEGIRLHQWIQKRMPSEYHAEVPLSFVMSYNDYDLVIEGRADGIVYDKSDEKPLLIDEIKGTHKDIEQINEPAIVHEAQAMCYGFFCANAYKLEGMDIQITYGNLSSKMIKRFVNYYTYDDLEEYFLDIMDKYKPFSDYIYKWNILKAQSISDMVFPYEYRDGQRSIMSRVYNTIKDQSLLFIQAPTGVGKTISTIYPSLKAMNDYHLSKIFYLTAKTVTKTVAKDTFALLRTKGYRLKMLEITAKDKICPLEERVCDASHCQYAKGHFDRINSALYKIICEEDLFTSDIITSYADEDTVCPYRLSLEIADFADEIVCDYNYVFDPNACLVTQVSDKNNIFLIDEAHNLVERARNMYSVTIVKEDVLAMKKHYCAYDKSLIKYFDNVNKAMLELKKLCNQELIVENRDRLDTTIINLRMNIEKFLDKKVKMTDRNNALEFYFKLCNYVDTLNFVDDTYVTYADYNESGCFQVHLCNLDPSIRLQSYLDEAVSTIFFSATLLPINYYKELLCNKNNPTAIYARSVFSSSQRALLVASDVTSKYSLRSDDMYMRIVDYIIRTAKAKKGNYIVYCPSYVFMDRVHSIMSKACDDIDIIVQKRTMTEHDREEFIREFDNTKDVSLVAFCVLGGIYSEGIDLVGSRLIGTIIVGTGLAQTNYESDLLSKYHEERGKNGFNYAYRYPGMNKVCQAAGRVIRTVDDKGVILLLDYRFNQYAYKSIFPREWADYKVTDIDKIDEDLRLFWR